MIKHFMIGQLLNLPFLGLALLMTAFFLGAFYNENPSNYSVYFFRGWISSFNTTLSALWVVSFSQLGCWIYWLIALLCSKVPGLFKRGLQWIGIFLGVIGILIFPLFLDFSEEARESAMEYQAYLAERKELKREYKEHLRQLPSDVKLQALGAYVLTLEAGTHFVDYLHLSDELGEGTSFGSKLAPLKVDANQNEVLAYLQELNPNLDPTQIRKLALNLYQDSSMGFMYELKEPKGYELRLGKRPLAPQILHFEATYFQYTLYEFKSADVDKTFVKSVLEGIIFRMNQTENTMDLSNSELEIIAQHRAFYESLLSQLNQRPEVIMERFEAFCEDHSLFSYEFDPYRVIVAYLLGVNYY